MNSRRALKLFAGILLVCRAASANSGVAFCKHFLELAMIDLSDQRHPLIDTVVQKQLRQDPLEAALSMLTTTAASLESANISYQITPQITAENPHFDIKIQPDSRSPLGLLAGEFAKMELPLLLSSRASTGESKGSELQHPFVPRLPLEAVALGMDDLSTIKRAVERTFFEQDALFLQIAVLNPETLINGSSPALRTAANRFRIRKQRRFHHDVDLRDASEVDYLMAIGESVDQLNKDPKNPERHWEFAALLKMYLSATGLPTEIVATKTGPSVDILIRPQSRAEWLETAYDESEYPEFLQHAVQLKNQQNVHLAWNTSMWLKKRPHNQAVSNENLYVYLVPWDAFSEVPSTQTLAGIRYMLGDVNAPYLQVKAPKGKSMESIPHWSAYIYQIENDVQHLRGLLAMRYSIRPTVFKTLVTFDVDLIRGQAMRASEQLSRHSPLFTSLAQKFDLELSLLKIKPDDETALKVRASSAAGPSFEFTLRDPRSPERLVTRPSAEAHVRSIVARNRAEINELRQVLISAGELLSETAIIVDGL